MGTVRSGMESPAVRAALADITLGALIKGWGVGSMAQGLKSSGIIGIAVVIAPDVTGWLVYFN